LKPVHKEILLNGIDDSTGKLAVHYKKKKNTRFKDPTHKIRRQGKQESFIFTD